MTVRLRVVRTGINSFSLVKLSGVFLCNPYPKKMHAEKVLELLARVLHEKCREIAEDSGSRMDFEARLSEIVLCREIIFQVEKSLDVVENKLASEWARSRGKRVVWKLWRRLRLR